MPTAEPQITLRFLAAPTDAGYSGNVSEGRVCWSGSTKPGTPVPSDGPAPTA
jgi:hypothetical protein